MLFNLFISLLLIISGAFLLRLAIDILKYKRAYNKASRYIKARGITDGVLVKHGMVIDPKTGLVRGTSSPSSYAIKKFLK